MELLNDRNSMKIDSHQHFWAINDTDYVWMTDEYASLRRDFLPDDLAPLLAAGGIDACIAVQARQFVRETDFLLDLAARDSFIAGVVGWVPLCASNVERYLEQYADHEKIVGFRHVVHDEPDDQFILRPDFNAGVEALGRYPLCYDILIFKRHLPQTISFIDRHPNISMVVDHIAKPVIRREAFDEEWAAEIRELGRRKHVSCKVSGMLTEVRDTQWDVDLLRPYFETILEAFGSSRVLFGSDWPVCLLRAGHPEWTRIAAELTSSLSADEQAAFWGGNARRIYRIRNIDSVTGASPAK